jgi:hypothetical protein
MAYETETLIKMTLTDIANRVGTDKGTLEHLGSHGYTETYHELFSHLLDKEVKMLEIGVNDPRFPGASMVMWKDYFPNLTFIGYDINPDTKKFERDNIKVFIGDQNNPNDIQKCIDEYGGNFDIIVDDGSHFSEHILKSFTYLFPYVKPGGYYIIEDLHSVYSNAAFTTPEVSRIIEDLKFNTEHVLNKHHGKMIVIKKAP